MRALITLLAAVGMTLGGLALAVPATTPSDGYPACKWEDGSDSDLPCTWYADRQGNGQGQTLTYFPGKDGPDAYPPIVCLGTKAVPDKCQVVLDRRGIPGSYQ